MNTEVWGVSSSLFAAEEQPHWQRSVYLDAYQSCEQPEHYRSHVGRFPAQLSDSLNWLAGFGSSGARKPSINRRTDVHVTRQLINWLTRRPSRWQSETPPSAVSRRCPSTRLSDDPSRSASRDAGRGEVGRRRTGSGARSGWTTRCLGPPGLSVWKHCEKVEGVIAREWIPSRVTWLEGSSVSYYT